MKKTKMKKTKIQKYLDKQEQDAYEASLDWLVLKKGMKLSHVIKMPVQLVIAIASLDND